MRDVKYWKQIAAFAYSEYLVHGDGAVWVKEQSGQPLSVSNIWDFMEYIPFNPDNDDLPLDAVGMIVEYEPTDEVVLVTTDPQGQTTCLQLTAAQIGITPKEAYKELQGDLVADKIYQLRHPIGCIQPGYFIFKHRDKAQFVFYRLGFDKDGGNICQTDDIVRVHQDFRGFFVNVDMGSTH